MDSARVTGPPIPQTPHTTHQKHLFLNSANTPMTADRSLTHFCSWHENRVPNLSSPSMDAQRAPFPNHASSREGPILSMLMKPQFPSSALKPGVTVSISSEQTPRCTLRFAALACATWPDETRMGRKCVCENAADFMRYPAFLPCRCAICS